MNEPKSSADDITRIIMLIYGMMENSSPFWLFAAVRPSKYQAFLTAQKDGTLDLHNFKPYGEIIVSGEGKSPPDDVTLKLAEMYQTTPKILQKAMDDAKPEDK